MKIIFALAIFGAGAATVCVATHHQWPALINAFCCGINVGILATRGRRA